MVKKFGLGKGLGALIPDEIDENVKHENIIDSSKSNNMLISLNKIRSDKEQPRKAFDSEKIVELAQSIKQHGIIQPLIVRQVNKSEFVIVAGERRWRAAKIAGLKELPCITMDISDKDILEISLIENIQREDLNPIEEALA